MVAVHVCQVWWTLAYKSLRTRRHKSRRTLCQGRSVRACVHSVDMVCGYMPNSSFIILLIYIIYFIIFYSLLFFIILLGIDSKCFWPRLTYKRVEPVVSISWASCFCHHKNRTELVAIGLSVYGQTLEIRRQKDWVITTSRRHVCA